MCPSVWQESEDAFTQWCYQDMEYSCEYCLILYQSEETLFQHIVQVHKVPREKYLKDNPCYSKNIKEVTCNVCGSATESLFQHLENTHHKMAPEVYFMRFVYQEPGEFHFVESYGAKEEEKGLVYKQDPIIGKVPEDSQINESQANVSTMDSDKDSEKLTVTAADIEDSACTEEVTSQEIDGIGSGHDIASSAR